MSRSNKSFLASPWPWMIAAGLVALYTIAAPYLARMQGPGDNRPVGTVDDIAALAERDDLNVLFIVIDTLRADRLGTYGYERNTSPLLDLVASRGIRFDRHLAQSSWTKCSMASMWTSLYPNRSGVTRFDEVVSPDAMMPAEVFAEAGFRTAGIFRNGWVMGYFGFSQGFETYIRPPPEQIPEHVRAENPTIDVRGSDLDVVASTREFLRVHGHERWFLYTHLMDVHEYLYSEETAAFGTSYSDIYDNSILWVNSVLNDLFEELAREGHLDNTLIVITSDHGEAFGERGFEGHARHVYRETTEVPLILSLPFRLEEPIVVSARTAGVDLWPTLFDLLGLPGIEESDGRSFLPEILAAGRGEAIESAGDDRVAYAYLDQNWGRRNTEEKMTLAVLEGPLRYMLYRDDQGERIAEMLFDRTDDPGELNDIQSTAEDELLRMRELGESYIAKAKPAFGTQSPLELDEIQLNQLRALGYDVP